MTTTKNVKSKLLDVMKTHNKDIKARTLQGPKFFFLKYVSWILDVLGFLAYLRFFCIRNTCVQAQGQKYIEVRKGINRGIFCGGQRGALKFY